MSEVHVFLGGEGRNELGSRAGPPPHQTDESPGVVAALLRRCHAEGWRVVGATAWKNITKLRAKGPTLREEQNVLGLVLEAKRARAHVVAFVRDADGAPERATIIDGAIAKAREKFPEVEVIGGTAVPVLEGWLLALRGQRGTEELSKVAAQTRLKEDGIPPKDTPAMVTVIEDSTLDGVPEDAVGLRRWIGVAREVLPRRVQAAVDA